jgi:hypothetical protein
MQRVTTYTVDPDAWTRELCGFSVNLASNAVSIIPALLWLAALDVYAESCVVTG